MSNAIDFAHLDKYVMGDITLRNEVLEIFVEQLGTLLSSMDPCKEDTAWKNAAHTLKGASRGVGAWDIGALSEEAEALVGDIKNKRRAREMLVEALERKAEAAIGAAKAACETKIAV